MNVRPRLLLHICCAPDSTAVFERLNADYQVTGYFNNNNLFPPEEYTKRRYEAERVAMNMGFLLEQSPYLPERWERDVQGFESAPEGGDRCYRCFKHNLMATARKACELYYPFFTTTLTISPHKESKRVFEAGREASQAFGVQFLEIDFKKKDGFKRSLELSKQMELYRQNYCGCKFSTDHIQGHHA
jgi:predicted adenine nucleotide alpha hydrolase (AANH) superfamily ATPase